MGGAELVTRLTALRITIGDEHGIAPYMIFSEETLNKLASIRPISRTSLQRMGMAQAKIEKFGDRFTTSIREWCKKKGMPSDVFPDSGSGSGPKLDDTTLNDTQKTSVSLFLDHGHSVETVASMRVMKPL